MTKPKTPATPKTPAPAIDRAARSALRAIGAFIKAQSWPVDTDEVIAEIDRLAK